MDRTPDQPPTNFWTFADKHIGAVVMLGIYGLFMLAMLCGGIVDAVTK